MLHSPGGRRYKGCEETNGTTTDSEQGRHREPSDLCTSQVFVTLESHVALPVLLQFRHAPRKNHQNVHLR